MQAISSIATRPQALHRVFCIEDAILGDVDDIQSAANLGLYVLRVFDRFRHGKWMYVVLDDFVPIHATTDKIAFARARDKHEVWPSLLEKVFAKVSGCYQRMVGSDENTIGPNLAFPVLTSGSFHMDSPQKSNVEDMWTKLKLYLGQQWLVGAGTPDDESSKEKTGIVGKRAYAIIAVCELPDGDRVVRLRNTWGRYEWKGLYSDDSSVWTDEKKKLAGWSKADDGIFFMTVEDVSLC